MSSLGLIGYFLTLSGSYYPLWPSIRETPADFTYKGLKNVQLSYKVVPIANNIFIIKIINVRFSTIYSECLGLSDF